MGMRRRGHTCVSTILIQLSTKTLLHLTKRFFGNHCGNTCLTPFQGYDSISIHSNHTGLKPLPVVCHPLLHMKTNSSNKNTMKTQISKIIRDVEIALNEVNPNQAAFVGDRDNADLSTVIESQIEASVDELHKTTDISKMALDVATDINYNGDTADHRFVYRKSTGVLTILLKSFDEGFETTFDADMLRLVYARAKGWPFDVTNDIFPDDPLFAIVTDKYVGAQVDFPAVTHRRRNVTVNGELKAVDVLELRCLERQSDWAHVSFIPKAKISYGMVNVDSRLYHTLIDLITHKVQNIINL